MEMPIRDRLGLTNDDSRPWLRFHIPLIEPDLQVSPHPALGLDARPSPTAVAPACGQACNHCCRYDRRHCQLGGPPSTGVGTLKVFTRFRSA